MSKLAGLLLVLLNMGVSILYLGVSLRLLELASPGVVLGLSYSLFQLMSMISGVVVPRYMYRWYGYVLVLASVLTTLCAVVIALSTSYLVVALVFALTGFLTAAITPAVTFLLTAFNEDRKSSLMTLTLPQNLGWCLGFLIGAIFCYVASLRQVLVFAVFPFALSVVCAALLLRYFRETTSYTHQEQRSQLEATTEPREMTTFLMLFYMSVFVGFVAASVFFTALPPVLRKLGLANFEIFAVRFAGALFATISYLYVVNIMWTSLDRVLHKVCLSQLTRAVLFSLLLPPLLMRVEHTFLLALCVGLLALIGLAWSYLHTGLRSVALWFGIHAHRIVGYTNSASSLGLVIGSFIAGVLLDLDPLLVPLVAAMLSGIAALLSEVCARTARRLSDMGSIISYQHRPLVLTH